MDEGLTEDEGSGLHYIKRGGMMFSFSCWSKALVDAVLEETVGRGGKHQTHSVN